MLSKYLHELVLLPTVIKTLYYTTNGTRVRQVQCFLLHYFYLLSFSRRCPSELMPPSVVGLWLSLSLMTSGKQELKKLEVYQVKSNLKPPRISAVCLQQIQCVLIQFSCISFVRFSSHLLQGSEVSHLCQWSIVNVGKNNFLRKLEQYSR